MAEMNENFRKSWEAGRLAYREARKQRTPFRLYLPGIVIVAALACIAVYVLEHQRSPLRYLWLFLLIVAAACVLSFLDPKKRKVS